MKKLNNFVKFDNTFFDNLLLQVGEAQPLFDYVDGKKGDTPVGYKISCSILVDDNDYGDGNFALNETEQFIVKVRFPMWADGLPDVFKARHRACKLLNPDAKTYGQWGNNLSVTVTDPHQIKFTDFGGRQLKGYDDFGYRKDSDN